MKGKYGIQFSEKYIFIYTPYILIIIIVLQILCAIINNCQIQL